MTPLAFLPPGSPSSRVIRQERNTGRVLPTPLLFYRAVKRSLTLIVSKSSHSTTPDTTPERIRPISDLLDNSVASAVSVYLPIQ
ncbi:hypothetical protein GWI33_018635 [Rhynchophorus ferrugineus]|uniref:Uncharacterized protein n=1 Tax=Rhynchophorus ferrugineus TaxID=354439 RepID=A0A834HVF0_RHYFE|nr:hypothetical protein GWI33_018635 [Rhynchophorus ferrugineus]